MAFQTMTNEPTDKLSTPTAANYNPTASEKFQQEREMFHRQLLSTVSHDLKTPLASVIGSLEIHEKMSKQLSEEKKQILIQTALNEAYRLDNFLTNILDMGKLEGNLVPFKTESSDIRHLLESAVGNLATRLAQADVSIIGVAHVSGMVDPAMFVRAINLMLDNAIKHAGAAAKIDIRYTKNGNKLTVEVIDNGPGILNGKEEEIFSKYTRLARGDHQNAGTGLGLSIVRLIAQKMGGRVRAANNDSGGARFILECLV